MSRLLTVIRITAALVAGGVVGALLVPAVFTFNDPNGWSLWTATSYFAYSVVASFSTLPTAIIAGAVSYPLLRFVPQRMQILFFAAAGVLAAAALCVTTSPIESIAQFMLIGAVSAIVAFLLLPRSNRTVERDAPQAARLSP